MRAFDKRLPLSCYSYDYNCLSRCSSSYHHLWSGDVFYMYVVITCTMYMFTRSSSRQSVLFPQLPCSPPPMLFPQLPCSPPPMLFPQLPCSLPLQLTGDDADQIPGGFICPSSAAEEYRFRRGD